MAYITTEINLFIFKIYNVIQQKMPIKDSDFFIFFYQNTWKFNTTEVHWGISVVLNFQVS